NIIIGIFLTMLGLILFLTAVNSGFMDMGRMLGMKIASLDTRILILVGFLLGLIIVLVEPAVHVLGEQIENVSGGSIPISIIRMTLSIGVGIAIAISMLRIVSPNVKLWYFLLPGFLMAVILSFFADPIFVGIAYDAGGVASGPMTATFVLAFAQGAASSIPTANVLVDGFGVIAMVAMAPVFSLMLLGVIFKQRQVVEKDMPELLSEEGLMPLNVYHHFVMVTIDRGLADKVIDIARGVGATGATVFHGRASYEDHKVQIPLMNMEIQEEQEMVCFVTEASVSTTLAQTLATHSELKEHNPNIYMTYTDLVPTDLD
ncbi:MAG TPA: DUF1538 domain-containing protein, partial [Erysipelothrix sp.]|nr:DUF1538 domain-containing protein [Erysipelothrix sp.]